MQVPSLQFWQLFKKTYGAFSTAEAIALMNICGQVPEGDYAELGVHKGKSAMCAALALPSGIFTLIDPEFSDKQWDDKVYNLVSAINDSVSILTLDEKSPEVIYDMGMMAYVFIDSGSHSDELPMQEVKALEDKMIHGGIIAFHDKGSQFTKVDEAYDYLVSTGKYDIIHIDWQPIFDYVKEHNLEEGNNSWHLYPELPHPPNFVGALRRK